ncbi:hypothetical protein B0T24DRAFT_674445 [Lasiosphaeria ovina]|uniref:F-box domain-containing protein n=1 Tax=Lasiosphaeria ovina TaxID=92902 RepID=A0AAE0NNB6_9PEZI|nr:hypothetical protein B0T24DRAFT_674445 [Lasiosphaeria ovina]
MNAMASTNGSPRFLVLPPEIRNKIYRLLLCHPTTLGNQWSVSPVPLSAQLLRTCRQVRAEGLSILYGENTFNIMISNTYGPHYSYINYSRGLEGVFGKVSFGGRRPHRAELLPCLRRFEIEVRYTEDHKLSFLRDSARKVVAELQKVSRIEYLKLDCKLDCENEYGEINWYDRCWDNYVAEGIEPECSRMLRTWLGRLRNVKEVVIKGMPKEDSVILKERWQSDEPLEKTPPLIDVYKALEEDAQGYRFCDDNLLCALLAMERDDVEAFEACKGAIVESVRQGWEELRDALFHHPKIDDHPYS